MNGVDCGGRRKTWENRNEENVQAVTRLTVGGATDAYARQSALGLLPLGGDLMNRGERRASGLPTRARRYHSENARLFFRRCRSSRSAVNQLRAAYWLPAAGLPAFRMAVAAAKMRAAL